MFFIVFHWKHIKNMAFTNVSGANCMKNVCFLLVLQQSYVFFELCLFSFVLLYIWVGVIGHALPWPALHCSALPCHALPCPALPAGGVSQIVPSVTYEQQVSPKSYPVLHMSSMCLPNHINRWAKDVWRIVSIFLYFNVIPNNVGLRMLAYVYMILSSLGLLLHDSK